MKTILSCLFLLFLAGIPASAQLREWTSASDPAQKIEASLVTVEGEFITLKMADGRTVKFELAKLSEADRHFARTGKEPEPEIMKEPFDASRSLATVVQDFRFDESPDQVYVRLRKHGGLQGGLNEILRGRTGLNDHYYVEIDGIRYGLFFEFGGAGVGLIEASLQSRGYQRDEYDTGLKLAWQALREGLEKDFGEPALRGNLPAIEQLQDGMSLSTDVWKTEKGQVYLGVGFADGAYSCVVKAAKKPFLQ